MQMENKIRAWIHNQPGIVVAHSPQAVFREAMAMFTAATGVACDPGLFTDATWRAGFRPDQRGENWILALPEKPHASDSHFRRLRNIVR